MGASGGIGQVNGLFGDLRSAPSLIAMLAAAFPSIESLPVDR